MFAFALLALLETFWHVLQSLPGLFQSVGYVFGFLLASWTLDHYFPGNKK